MGAASQHPIACRICCTLIIFVWVILLAPTISAQDELARARWQRATSEHFTVYSQPVVASNRALCPGTGAVASGRRQRYAGAGHVPAPGDTQLRFRFDRLDDFQQFTLGEDAAFFYPTPRANFMALVANDATALRLARHHYGHFLLRNFADLRLPRWFEEGLSAYLGRLEVGDDGFRFEQYTARNNEVMAQISEQFSMQRLFFNTAALASPRVIQIANLKAEALYYYLRHGYLERGFPDRRQQLQNYIDLLLAGRNHRFAYDRSFDVTTAELDTEFQRFLQQSRRPRVDVEMSLPAPDTVAVQRVSAQEASIILGDLALNGGRPEIAERFLDAALMTG